MNWFPLFLSAGVFIGSFLFHAAQGNHGKGAIIGGVAALFVLMFYSVKALLSYPDEPSLQDCRLVWQT